MLFYEYSCIIGFNLLYLLSPILSYNYTTMLKNYFVRLFIAMLMVITPLYFISCEVPVDEETIIEDNESNEDNEDNEGDEDNEDTDTEPEQDWFTLTIDEVTDHYHTAEFAHYPFNCIDFTFNGTNIVDFEWATDKFSDVANSSDDDLMDGLKMRLVRSCLKSVR